MWQAYGFALAMIAVSIHCVADCGDVVAMLLAYVASGYASRGTHVQCCTIPDWDHTLYCISIITSTYSFGNLMYLGHRIPGSNEGKPAGQ